MKEVSSFYGGDPDLPVSKQKKNPRDKNLDQAKREFLQALRQTKVGNLSFKDAQEFDKRMMDVLEKAIDNKIKDIAQDYKVFGKKLEEQEQSPLNTVGDLRKALSKAIGAKRMGKAKDAAIDIAIGAIFDLVPGAGTAKSVFDIAKSIYSLPDDKKTNTALDYLNVDDDVSKIVDDGIENAFLKVLANELKKFKDDVPLQNLNMTKMLNNYIMRQYNKRKVDSPEEK